MELYIYIFTILLYRYLKISIYKKSETYTLIYKEYK